MLRPEEEPSEKLCVVPGKMVGAGGAGSRNLVRV